MRRHVLRGRAEDRGATSVEYALIVTVAIAVALTIGLLGTAVLGLFNDGVGIFP